MSDTLTRTLLARIEQLEAELALARAQLRARAAPLTETMTGGGNEG